jgi:hypothetical protein
MRDKCSDRDSKMFVTSIDDPVWLGGEAKRMATELLNKEKRPIGDTFEAAAYRLQMRHRVGVAPIILQCWNRAPREMKVSRWMTVFYVHWKEFGAKADAAYEEKRKTTNAHPALVRLADFVAGRTVHEEETQ